MNDDSQQGMVEGLISINTAQKLSGDMPRSTLYYRIKHDGFPAPVRLGKRGVAWKRSEVLEWINSRERSITQGGES